MPYISKHARKELNPDLLQLSKKINCNGSLNYCITMLVRQFVGKNIGYEYLNSAIGVLECAKLELYRNMVAPYENEKIEENGELENLEEEY